VTPIEALRRLESLGTPGFETRDASALLHVPMHNASKILKRLETAGFLLRANRGRWLLAHNLNRQILPELLAAPYPAYISLQSALYHHGLIEQIPAVIYAVTIGRPRRIKTPTGTVSLHRVPPPLFTGFEVMGKDAVKMATPEKALFDVIYLAPGRTRLFTNLPELEIPRNFKWKELRRYTELVKSVSRRAFLEKRIGEIKDEGTKVALSRR
jgi:predicted transcriptional regulator of viral defense system